MCLCLSLQSCETCPPNAHCAGGDAGPAALPGFYLISLSEFDACRPPHACLGGNGTRPCEAGYQSVRCSQCKVGYYRLSLDCVTCPNMSWIFILLFIVGIISCMLLGVWLNSRRINLAALGIGVDFAQVAAMFITFQFQWPSQLRSLFTSISLFSFNIQILAPEVCVCVPLCAPGHDSMG